MTATIEFIKNEDNKEFFKLTLEFLRVTPSIGTMPLSNYENRKEIFYLRTPDEVISLIRGFRTGTRKLLSIVFNPTHLKKYFKKTRKALRKNYPILPYFDPSK